MITDIAAPLPFPTRTEAVVAKLDSNSTPEHTQAGNGGLDHETGCRNEAAGPKDWTGQEGSAPWSA